LLAGVVHRVVATADSGGRKLDDGGGPSGLHHHPCGRAHAAKAAGEVHVHDPLPLLIAQLEQGRAREDTGVVHQHVATTECARNRVEQSLNLLADADVRLHEQTACGPRGLRHQLRRRLVVNPVDDDGCALARERGRDGGPDARLRTRDHHHTVIGTPAGRRTPARVGGHGHRAASRRRYLPWPSAPTRRP